VEEVAAEGMSASPDQIIHHIDQRRALPLRIGGKEGQYRQFLRRTVETFESCAETSFIKVSIRHVVFALHAPGCAGAAEHQMSFARIRDNTVRLKKFNR